MEIEEKNRIEDGRKKLEIEEEKAKLNFESELKEIELKNYKKRTDKIYLYFMEFIFVILTPFVLISLFIEITETNTVLAIVCVLMYCGIKHEEKAILKEQNKRKDTDKEISLQAYSKTLEELNEKRKEYLTEEEKEAIRKEEEARKIVEMERQKAEELKKEEERKREYEKKLEKQRKLNNLISTFETIGAVARVLNMILDIVLCIVFLPLGLLACFLTAVAQSDNRKRKK